MKTGTGKKVSYLFYQLFSNFFRHEENKSSSKLSLTGLRKEISDLFFCIRRLIDSFQKLIELLQKVIESPFEVEFIIFGKEIGKIRFRCLSDINYLDNLPTNFFCHEENKSSSKLSLADLRKEISDLFFCIRRLIDSFQKLIKLLQKVIESPFEVEFITFGKEIGKIRFRLLDKSKR